MKAALGYFSDWNNLGLKLGLHPDLLQRISDDKPNVDGRLQEVLRKWLKNEELRPSWNQLVIALKPIDCALSNQIKRDHPNEVFE